MHTHIKPTWDDVDQNVYSCTAVLENNVQVATSNNVYKHQHHTLLSCLVNLGWSSLHSSFNAAATIPVCHWVVSTHSLGVHTILIPYGRLSMVQTPTVIFNLCFLFSFNEGCLLTEITIFGIIHTYGLKGLFGLLFESHHWPSGLQVLRQANWHFLFHLYTVRIYIHIIGRSSYIGMFYLGRQTLVQNTV